MRTNKGWMVGAIVGAAALFTGSVSALELGLGDTLGSVLSSLPLVGDLGVGETVGGLVTTVEGVVCDLTEGGLLGGDLLEGGLPGGDLLGGGLLGGDLLGGEMTEL